MPVKRRRSKRRGDLGPAEWSYLLDEPMPDDTWGSMAYFALDVDAVGRTSAIWSTHGDAAVEEYARNNPGQRPRLWWLYNAPEQRRRLSDTPAPWEPVWERASCLHVSRFEYGIPKGAREDDYESQAEYLERLGLWRLGERERLETMFLRIDEVVQRGPQKGEKRTCTCNPSYGRLRPVAELGSGK